MLLPLISAPPVFRTPCPPVPQAEVSSLRKELGTEMVSALTQEEQAEMTWVAGVRGCGHEGNVWCAINMLVRNE